MINESKGSPHPRLFVTYLLTLTMMIAVAAGFPAKAAQDDMAVFFEDVAQPDDALALLQAIIGVTLDHYLESYRPLLDDDAGTCLLPSQRQPFSTRLKAGVLRLWYDPQENCLNDAWIEVHHHTLNDAPFYFVAVHSYAFVQIDGTLGVVTLRSEDEPVLVPFRPAMPGGGLFTHVQWLRPGPDTHLLAVLKEAEQTTGRDRLHVYRYDEETGLEMVFDLRTDGEFTPFTYVGGRSVQFDVLEPAAPGSHQSPSTASSHALVTPQWHLDTVPERDHDALRPRTRRTFAWDAARGTFVQIDQVTVHTAFTVVEGLLAAVGRSDAEQAAAYVDAKADVSADMRLDSELFGQLWLMAAGDVTVGPDDDLRFGPVTVTLTECGVVDERQLDCVDGTAVVFYVAHEPGELPRIVDIEVMVPEGNTGEMLR